MDDDLAYHSDDVGLSETGQIDWWEPNCFGDRSERPTDRGCEDDAQKAMQRFVQFVRSPTNTSRQVGRCALKTLRLVAGSAEDVLTVLDLVCTVAQDNDSAVRCDIMQFVSHMALILTEDAGFESQKSLIAAHLLPAVVNVLADPNPQVYTVAETALLNMLEHCLIESEDVEHKVWPVIQGRITTDATVESYNTVISMMTKIAPWVGCDLTERLFVPLLVNLSSNSEFLIRHACSSIFGEICTVVGTQVTESKLLPCFLRLCCDSMWNIRKTCAEAFMTVSFACKLETRKRRLAPVFSALLSDSMRWVQLTAFQSLGPFITTFAEPSIAVLGYNHHGELVLKHPHGFEFKLHSGKLVDKLFCPLYHAMLQNSDDCDVMAELKLLTHSEKINLVLAYQEQEAENRETDTGTLENNLSRVNGETEEIEENKTRVNGETEEANQTRVNGEMEEDEQRYNQFNFWREPLPSVDVSVNGKPLQSSSPQDIDTLVAVLKDFAIWKENRHDKQNKQEGEASNNGGGESWKGGGRCGSRQDIVPEELINHFVSMSNPKQDRTELAHHCAYNLPAVALTLGPENWPFLKKAYETLAADRQWKVRRIVASSIHELAVIVGEDVATQDLVPVFNGFIKDLDEVRIGALKHLAHFLKLLRPAGRNSFLPRLAEFLVTDYDWNWRFREELAGQLVQALGLFTPSDTCHHLTPVVITLLLDKVSDVRKVALYLVTELVNHVSIDVTLLRGLLAELAEQFAHSSRWNRRQTFALLCSRLVTEQVLSDEMFTRDVLPHLLDLSWDPVPNVRLAVARTLAMHVMANHTKSAHHELLVSNLKRLQGDRDRDVRYFATLPPSDTPPTSRSQIHAQLQNSNSESATSSTVAEEAGVTLAAMPVQVAVTVAQAEQR